MNIVVIDAAALPQGVDFPLLNWNKYGWEQYLALPGRDLVERCWRADIVVSLTTDISAEALAGWHKLALLVVPENGSVNVDRAAMREDIEIAEVPGSLEGIENAEQYCQGVVAAIQRFLDRRLA